MRIKDGFILKDIAGEMVVVPVGENLVDFGAMVVLNDTGVFLWNLLQDEKDESQLLQAVLDEYDIDEQDAKQDITEFLDSLGDNNLLSGSYAN
ncbi:MAG: PqqD family protein [Clostridiaceae bacterium]|nr:PqqD family protein [Clostridiaceae bacterium]